MANNTETITTRYNLEGNAADVVKAIKKEVQDLADKMKKAMEIGDTQSLTKLRRSYHQALTELGNMTSKQEQFNTALGNMNLVDMKELLRLQKQIQTVMLSGAVPKGSREWDDYNKQLGKVNNQIAKMKTELDASGQGGLSKFFSKMTGNAGFGAVAGGLTKLAGAFGIALSAGRIFVDFVKETLRINKEFEQQQANLAAVLGKTRKEVVELTQQAKMLGETTLYTASQVSGLQINLAKLGFRESEIKQSTRAILDFALATGAQLPEAASVAGAALRAFSLPASQMERVVSTMAVATTKSALDFEKLRTSISITFPVAKAFGFTIEDTVTLLAKLSDAGFEASSAATATRNILLNMANPAGRLAKALGRPIHNINELGQAMTELKERNISLAEAFALTDKRSVSAFMRFVEASDSLQEFKDSITDVDEGLRKMVEEKMDTVTSSVTLLQSAWQGLMLTFQNSNGFFKRVIDNLTKVVHWVTTLLSTMPENVDRKVAIGVEEYTNANKKKWSDSFNTLYKGKSADDLREQSKYYEKQLQRYLGYQTAAQKRIRDLDEAMRLGIGTKKGQELSGGLNIDQAKVEVEKLTQDLIKYGQVMAETQYYIDNFATEIERLDTIESNFDKDAMKKQRSSIELQIKKKQKAEEERYLKEKEKFDDMSHEDQEKADKEHWEKMYEIEIQGYRQIAKLYTGNNDQLEASFEGRAVTSEKKLADKLFAITQQYANKDEKDALERERIRIKTGREKLEAAKANATAQANYEYEQFVLAGGKKDDAQRKLNADLLKVNQDYYKGLNTLYAADIKEDELSKKTKEKLRKQYDEEALRALADKNKKESEYNKKITDEVLKSEEELRKMQEQFDKQNKIDIFGEANAKLASKKYELDNMLSLYNDYFDNLLKDANLSEEEMAAINAMRVRKEQEILKRQKDWEKLNAKEKYAAVVDIASKAVEEISNLMSSVTTLVNQGYETQIAKVEARYDDEIAAAEKAGKDTTALEEAKEREVKQIQMKQAKSDMIASIAQIQIDTAMAIAKAWAGNPYLAAVMTALITANMAIQTATVKKQYEAKMASLGQYYEGGYTGSIDSSDRRYHRVAGVVHDGEFVANHNAVNNPSVRPVLDAIDYAQRNNTIASMTRDDVALAAGFANGGYTSRPGAVASTMASDSAIQKLVGVLNSLEKNGIEAYSVISGRRGSANQTNRYNKLRNNVKR